MRHTTSRLLAATLLLAHAMVIAAYLIHECAHNLVFSRARHNAALGRAMSFGAPTASGILVPSPRTSERPSPSARARKPSARRISAAWRWRLYKA
mgnify:CR=1 FL=1